MKRSCLLVMLIVIAGCARRVEVSSTAEWKGSCTVNSWWIEVPPDLSVGKETTARVHRCEGKATPATLKWSTSDASVLQLISFNADAAVVKGVGKGIASIVARSEVPVGRSEISVTVK